MHGVVGQPHGADPVGIGRGADELDRHRPEVEADAVGLVASLQRRAELGPSGRSIGTDVGRHDVDLDVRDGGRWRRPRSR